VDARRWLFASNKSQCLLCDFQYFVHVVSPSRATGPA
jgi:hypothetical protein